jgi:hypothetical protein
VKANSTLTFFDSGNKRSAFGIIIGILVTELQRLIEGFDFTPERTENIPELHTERDSRKIIIQVAGFFVLYGYRYPAYPNIFFCSCCMSPTCFISRFSIHFLDTSYILRTIAFIGTAIAHGADLTIDQ